MNIAILSKSDRQGGGASRVAEELNVLLNKNNKSLHFTRSSTYTKTYPLYGNYAKIIYHRLRAIGFQEIIPFELINIYKSHKVNKFDIFHFHDLTSAISPFTLKLLSRKNTVLMTIHDCSIVTGGCINPLDCEKYKTVCHNCPQKGEWPFGKRIDMSYIFHMIKKYILKSSNIHFIAPSKWMADFIYSTGLISSYPTIISNGVDTDQFIAYNKQEMRKKLNLPEERFIILFSSANLSSPLKGVTYTIDILNKLKDINPYILLVGYKDKEVIDLLSFFDINSVGYIEDKTLLNQYYASANILLNTTIADNQPITVLESMASGTPNIGFATGGIPEIITNNKDGYVVKNRNIKELIIYIRNLYHSREYIQMGINARATIYEKYSIDVFLEKHLNLYKDIINEYS